MRLFCFGLGYCARRIIARGESLEASGTTRGAEAATRLAARRRRGFRVRRRAQRGSASLPLLRARKSCSSARRQAKAAIPRSRISSAKSPPRRTSSASSISRASASTAIAAAPGSTRRARPRRVRRALAAARRRSASGAHLALRGASRSISSGSPASTGRAAMRSSSCAQARRGASSSRAKSSTASMSTISPRSLVRLIEAGGPGGLWNVADEEPAPPQDVVAFAAKLLGVAPPPEEAFETAPLSPMARSFYDDNRRVSVGKLRRELGYRWLYPTYREGLRALAAAGEGRESRTGRRRRSPPSSLRSSSAGMRKPELGSIQARRSWTAFTPGVFSAITRKPSRRRSSVIGAVERDFAVLGRDPDRGARRPPCESISAWIAAQISASDFRRGVARQGRHRAS